MKADPKLEILDGEHPIELAVLVVDNKTLTPEEQEAAAVLVAAMREGVSGLNLYSLNTPSGKRMWVLLNPTAPGPTHMHPTPLAAWRAYREEVGGP